MKQQNDTAWENFLNTGKVEDYLKYCVCKVEAKNASQEETKNASEHRRIGDTGTEYR